MSLLENDVKRRAEDLVPLEFPYLIAGNIAGAAMAFGLAIVVTMKGVLRRVR